MTDSQLLKSLVDEYHLEVDGVKFWTPYFINTPKSKGVTEGENLKGFLLGKGFPEQIKGELEKILGSQRPDEKDPEGYRKLMFENRLGVECSGFAYHVLDRFLQQKGKGSLIDQLMWSREELLREYDHKTTWHKPDLERSTVEAYPTWVPMGQVVSEWGWELPQKMVNVRRLVSIQSAKVFDNVRMLQPGDMIYEIGRDDEIDHVLIVVGIHDDIITCAHSVGAHNRPNYYGGVEQLQIKITDPSKPIQDQQWSNQFFLDTHTFAMTALRRLKVLDERAA